MAPWRPGGSAPEKIVPAQTVPVVATGGAPWFCAAYVAGRSRRQTLVLFVVKPVVAPSKPSTNGRCATALEPVEVPVEPPVDVVVEPPVLPPEEVPVDVP